MPKVTGSQRKPLLWFRARPSAVVDPVLRILMQDPVLAPGSLAVGEVGACDSRSATLQGPLSPLRVVMMATRWHCDPAEQRWQPESIESGEEASPPPPAESDSWCMGSAIAPPATAVAGPPPAALSTPSQAAASAPTTWGLSANALVCIPRGCGAFPITSLEQNSQAGGHQKGQLAVTG